MRMAAWSRAGEGGSTAVEEVAHGILASAGVEEFVDFRWELEAGSYPR
jgi:hypothetical protein